MPLWPTDATLSVTKAARLLGVHPNTVRAWSDAGRLRYYRINPRGDRRYRMGDLQRFLAAAEHGTTGPTAGGPSRRQVDLARIARTGGIPRAGSTWARATGSFGSVRSPDDADVGDPGHQALQRVECRHRDDLALLDFIARVTLGSDDLEDDLGRVVRAIREATGHDLVAIWEVRGERLTPIATAAAPAVVLPRLLDLPRNFGVLGRALDIAPHRVAAGLRDRSGEHGAGAIAVLAEDRDRVTVTVLPGERAELAVAIPGRDGPWGVLLFVADAPDALDSADQRIAAVLADALGPIVGVARREEEVAHLLHRAEALRRVASDIGSRIDLDRILSGLVDHAMVLFEGDRAAVFLRRAGNQDVAEVSRGLSAGYLNAMRPVQARSLPASAIAARRPLFAVDYRNDPRGMDVRAAVVQEGYDTMCSAPLMDGADLLGMLNVYHDRPHAWSSDELETISALASQASVAIRAAQDYQQMATWTAQLQSIQQLGARLSRLSSVKEIGLAIATELRQIIDYHNVRVYRLVGADLVPVAMRGQVGEYVDETSDQLRVAIGEGITGWVAEHRIAQNLPDAASDPRANTIPGTEDDLDESMLLAPMLFEEQVLGVVVLSKLGLHQFQDGDLRLLVIYANFAAQAMANADTTQLLREQTVALERQVRSQRELLSITESILTTLDRRAVLESITERLGGLIACDNIAIEIIDPATGLLKPLTARGLHAERYLEPWEPGETGVATWVVEHNEPVYVDDERQDPRVNHFRETDSIDGSLIVVPLRGRAGAIGVLTIERLGAGNIFAAEEFDLVKLFAAQVSIALQNAEVFRAVEIRAQTDALTGLLNHGTFVEYLERMVREGSPFGLIMLDLDDFRLINNTMGHQAGDVFLKQIGAVLGGARRDTDLIFRYGGDEFVFLLPHTDLDGTLHLAERARAAVKGLDGPVTASIGMATFPTDGASAAEILLSADRACFVAKRDGRDRVATAEEGLVLAAAFSLQDPTPVDSEATGGPS
ncbi:MAG: GAF domain-containing protein [Candidatus Limnocylindrales bacterium]